MNLDAPENLKVHLCILWLLFKTVPAFAELAQLPFTAQYKNTMQKYYSRKARGQITVHKQWPVTVHSNSAPDRIIEVTICFRLKRYSPEVKAIYLPWFQQTPEGIQGSLHLYKASLASVFSRLHFYPHNRSLNLRLHFYPHDRSHLKNSYLPLEELGFLPQSPLVYSLHLYSWHL